ncbi:MAG: hypothetical protein ABJF11_16545 [Reichenbachiella sp.]|uniref:hypothetical protein n=1 Tax=Reichenbachiella sp. TaxID=2184521 RepID=UPI0032648CA3
MKLIKISACLIIILAGCQPPQQAGNDAFEKNSKTAMAYLEGFQNESLDYASLYAEDVVIRGTGVNDPDSISLEDAMKQNDMAWANFDFKLLGDEVVLLPGVNVDTKMADGSVRYYGDWEVIRPATDSTEARSGIIKIYESFDFDIDGKIVFQQAYGDFSGIMMLMMGEGDSEDNADDDQM